MSTAPELAHDGLDDQLHDAAEELAAMEMPRLAHAVRRARELLLVRDDASCTRLVAADETETEDHLPQPKGT